MSWIDGLRYRIDAFLRRGARERESDEELHTHLELDTAQRLHRGASDARFAARRRLGNLTTIKENLHQLGARAWIDRLQQDLRYAIRGIRRSPGFAATVIVTIALGVGANAAVFSFLDQVFVRAPGGVSRPAELRRLYIRAHESPRLGAAARTFVHGYFTYPHYDAIRAASPGAPIAAFERNGVTIGRGEATTIASAVWVSPNYLSVLGVPIALGRGFGADESRIDVPAPVAIISHRLWKHSFAADSSIVGRTIDIGKRPVTVIGITRAGFSGIDIDETDVILPLNAYPEPPENGVPWYKTDDVSLTLLARVTNSNAESALLARSTFAYNHTPQIPRFSFDTTSTLLAGPIVQARGPASQQREVSIGLRVAGVALALLLIAVANVATLFLVRAARQRREVALRLALGASRSHVYAQLWTESAVLAGLGSVAALAVAWWGSAALRTLLLPSVSWATSAFDVRVIGATLVMSALVGLVAGSAPVMLSRRRDVLDAMKGGARDGVYHRSRLRTGLLAVQTALSVVLIAGAGLFVRSLGNVRAIEVGYAVDSLVHATAFIRNQWSYEPEVVQAIRVLSARMASEPGVLGATVSSSAPMGSWTGVAFALPGVDTIPRLSGDNPYPMLNWVAPEFFATVGMRIVAGRTFTPSDSGHAIVVNETMARTLWPGQDPIGKCAFPFGRKATCSYVVGVAANAHRMRIIEDASMNYFVPQTDGMTLILRVDPDRRATIMTRMRRELQSQLPTAATVTVGRLSDRLDRELRPWRLGASIFLAFGLLAVLVAAIGVYSVIAYAVSQRTREMGVRVALGARLIDVVRLVVGEGVRVVAAGVLIGVGASLALGKLVATLLYGVTPRDPLVLGAAALALLVIGGVAALWPALRAAKTDPITALRAE